MCVVSVRQQLLCTVFVSHALYKQYTHDPSTHNTMCACCINSVCVRQTGAGETALSTRMSVRVCLVGVYCLLCYFKEDDCYDLKTTELI